MRKGEGNGESSPDHVKENETTVDNDDDSGTIDDFTYQASSPDEVGLIFPFMSIIIKNSLFVFIYRC